MSGWSATNHVVQNSSRPIFEKLPDDSAHTKTGSESVSHMDLLRTRVAQGV